VPTSRHHRTVDRVVTILELVARSPKGLTLKELSSVLGAANSSIFQLTSGLVATGYLSEHAKIYTLGPGPLLLAHMSQIPAIQRVPHSYLIELNKESGLSVHLSVQLGDTSVTIDQVGLTSKTDFLAWDRVRRPLPTPAAGKIILANLPDADLHKILRSLQAEMPEDVETFLDELAGIRQKGLAFNLEKTISGVVSVATGVYDRSGSFVGAVSVSGPPDIKNRIDEIGFSLLKRVKSWDIP
jgi:IclR family acetate operon transcriptional repressor